MRSRARRIKRLRRRRVRQVFRDTCSLYVARIARGWKVGRSLTIRRARAEAKEAPAVAPTLTSIGAEFANACEGLAIGAAMFANAISSLSETK